MTHYNVSCSNKTQTLDSGNSVLKAYCWDKTVHMSIIYTWLSFLSVFFIHRPTSSSLGLVVLVGTIVTLDFALDCMALPVTVQTIFEGVYLLTEGAIGITHRFLRYNQSFADRSHTLWGCMCTHIHTASSVNYPSANATDKALAWIWYMAHHKYFGCNTIK